MTDTLIGRRVVLRQLRIEDFPQWRTVRRRNVEWLTKWEPQRLPGSPDVIEERGAFALRCHAREREWQLGSEYGSDRIEPGHMMEWAWILNQARKLIGEQVADAPAPKNAGY